MKVSTQCPLSSNRNGNSVHCPGLPAAGPALPCSPCCGAPPGETDGWDWAPALQELALGAAEKRPEALAPTPASHPSVNALSSVSEFHPSPPRSPSPAHHCRTVSWARHSLCSRSYSVALLTSHWLPLEIQPTAGQEPWERACLPPGSRSFRSAPPGRDADSQPLWLCLKSLRFTPTSHFHTGSSLHLALSAPETAFFSGLSSKRACHLMSSCRVFPRVFPVASGIIICFAVREVQIISTR